MLHHPDYSWAPKPFERTELGIRANKKFWQIHSCVCGDALGRLRHATHQLNSMFSIANIRRFKLTPLGAEKPPRRPPEAMTR